jgi:hypothetical protein
MLPTSLQPKARSELTKSTPSQLCYRRSACYMGNAPPGNNNNNSKSGSCQHVTSKVHHKVYPEKETKSYLKIHNQGCHCSRILKPKVFKMQGTTLPLCQVEGQRKIQVSATELTFCALKTLYTS